MYASAESALEGVTASRALLDEPDPIAPVVVTLTDALRDALGDRLKRFVATRDAGLAELAGSSAWQKLTDQRQAEILAEVGLANHQDPALGTTSELLSTLDAWPLGDWQVRLDALASQVATAHELAARESGRPTVVVKPPHQEINDEAELESYVEQLRGEIAGHLRDGNTVVI
jgi:hypothetical protein